jgi:hypothetical protein
MTRSGCNEAAALARAGNGHSVLQSWSLLLRQPVSPTTMIFSGCFELTFGSVIPSPSTCKDSPMGYTASQTVTAKVVGLGFVRGVMGR